MAVAELFRCHAIHRAIHQFLCTSASHHSLAGLMLSQKSRTYRSKVLLLAIAGQSVTRY